MQNNFRNGRIFSAKTGFCYKCCTSKHLSRNCKATIKCELCGISRHTTALHPDSEQEHNSSAASQLMAWRKRFPPNLQWIVNVLNSVDKLSVDDLVQKLLQFVCILPERKEHSILISVIVDEQSNKTLARSEFNINNANAPFFCVLLGYTLHKRTGRILNDLEHSRTYAEHSMKICTIGVRGYTTSIRDEKQMVCLLFVTCFLLKLAIKK